MELEIIDLYRGKFQKHANGLRVVNMELEIIDFYCGFTAVTSKNMQTAWEWWRSMLNLRTLRTKVTRAHTGAQKFPEGSRIPFTSP